MKKKLFPEEMEILYNRPFSEESLKEDFEIRAGKWYVEDGWLVGENRTNFAAMVISKRDFFGPILMEFDAETILPCTHDINVMWHGSFNDETNTRDVAYVAGLAGWWDGKVGFERSPEYKFNVGTQLFDFVPGKTYRMTVGDIGGHIFILADGKLLLEITDPDPINDQKYGRIGFEAYCSKLKFKNLCIKRASYEDDVKEYVPEF
jgi:hypothetical protein